MKFIWLNIVMPLAVGILGSLLASHIYIRYQNHQQEVLVRNALLAELRGNLQAVALAHFLPFDEPRTADIEIRKDVFSAAMANPSFRQVVVSEEPRRDYFPGVYSALDELAKEARVPLTNGQFGALRKKYLADVKQWLTPETMHSQELWFFLQHE
jgi:hypothetical protein